MQSRRKGTDPFVCSLMMPILMYMQILASKERKRGGTSASRDENGMSITQMDVWL